MVVNYTGINMPYHNSNILTNVYGEFLATTAPSIYKFNSIF